MMSKYTDALNPNDSNLNVSNILNQTAMPEGDDDEVEDFFDIDTADIQLD